MRKFNYALGMILASGMLVAAPVHAAPGNLDQYGCRSEKAGEYKCYQGEQAGKTFKNQNDMLSKTSTRPMGSQVEPSNSAAAPASPNAAPASPSGGTSGSPAGGSDGNTGSPRY